MPTDDDTVPVRRETLRHLIETVLENPEVYQDNCQCAVCVETRRAVREAEAALAGEEKS